MVGWGFLPPPVPPIAAVPPPPAAPAPLHVWAPGRWRSTGGTNTLVIERDLRWSWSSSAGGQWSGSGRGQIEDGRLLDLHIHKNIVHSGPHV